MVALETQFAHFGVAFVEIEPDPAAAQALGKNPMPLVIPCHRVTAAGGGLGGFSAPGGVDLKRRMIDLERERDAGGGGS